MKWYGFDSNKGYPQKHPAINKWVVLLVETQIDGIPNGLRIGYRINAAGCVASPQFIIPGGNYNMNKQLKVIAWCDCLNDGFDYPKELTKEHDGR